MRLKVFDVEKIDGEFNPSDLGTKPLPRSRFEMLRTMIGLEMTDVDEVQEKEGRRRDPAVAALLRSLAALVVRD